MKKRLVSILTIVTLLICSISASAQQTNEVDEYLLDAGFPQSIVETMSETKKDYIYEITHNKEDIAFCSYEEKQFNINEEGLLSEISTTPRGGQISPSDLTVDVIGIVSNTSEGIEYSVFPSFVWNVVKKVKNDSFSMSMYSGWEAVPGARNLRLYFINAYGNSTYTDLNPTQSNSSGYTFKVPSSTGAVQGLYEGHGYYDLIKKASNPTPAISLHYTHDASSSMTVSYGINLGVGSISVSSNSSYLYTFSDNFNVEGLY